MATVCPRSLIKVCDSLPRLSFPQLAAPGVVALHQGTRASVVFLPHRGCPACAQYMEELGNAVEGLQEWATRAMVLVPDGDAPVPTPGVLWLTDAGGAGRAQIGVGSHQAAVVQSDRWGAVYEVGVVAAVDASHAGLPTASQLVELAKFIDIQCPECEVPSQEWLSASPFPLG